VSRRSLVAKTYKLYLGGAFARSESGRSDPTADHAGAHVANVPRASRKDVRDAVKAARGAQAGWAKRTAYNRGQVLYRFAEALEARSDELARAGVAQRDLAPDAARDELGAAVDTLVHYAGWTDKLAAVMGGINPVAAPYLSFSAPEPTGVVAVLAPDEPDLLGLVREIAPALAAGNTVVAIVSRRWPARALDLGEVAAVSDVPAGTLNLLCGRMDELLTPLCGHRDVNAIVDATGDPARAAAIDELAAETVKRVSRPSDGAAVGAVGAGSLARLEALTELKTAWHPVGS
jgi:acyl-CoA reductase-like NAD-dependent aldehyde dehydrogenase